MVVDLRREGIKGLKNQLPKCGISSWKSGGWFEIEQLKIYFITFKPKEHFNWASICDLEI